MSDNTVFFRRDIQHRMGLLTEAVLAATILIFFTSTWGLNYVFQTSFGLALAPLGLFELYNVIANIINLSKKPSRDKTHMFYHCLLGFLAAGFAVFPISLTIFLQFAKWNPFLFSVATFFLALKGIEHVIFDRVSKRGSFLGLFIKGGLGKLAGFIALCLALHNVSPASFATSWTNPIFSMFALSGIAYALDTLYKSFFEKT
mgnify:FL=1